MNKPIKIPTIIALLLVGTLVASMVFVTKIISTQTQADASTSPKDIQITNITDTSFTVIWKTEKPTRGVIQVRQGTGQPLTFYDENSVQSSAQNLLTHSVTARGMKPQTTYQITFSEKQNTPQTVTTGPTLTLNSNQLGPAYGSVKTKEGAPAEGALVVMKLTGSQTLSTTVKGSGNFLIPLNLLRTQDTLSYVPVGTEPLQMDITVVYENELANAITTTANSSPIPDITIGQTYDFRQQSKLKTSTPAVAQLNNSFSSVLGTNKEMHASSSVILSTPLQGDVIKSQFPFITGRGIPDEIVTIVLGSKNPHVETTRVKKDSTWNVTPKKPLSEGNQSITITSFDQNKKPVAITHLFQVMKSGTQVLGDATPSASPTIITPSPIATLSATPIPTQLVTPVPTEEIPTTATTMPTYIVLIIGMFLTVTGLIVFAL